MDRTPYQNIDPRQIWKHSIGEKNLFSISDLYNPKFEIRNTSRFATYGSCFAQHFSQRLRNSGMHWINAEPAPLGIKPEISKEYSYGIYSSRTQNIYTPTMLLQWLEMEKHNFNEVWSQDGRFFDPIRPTVEPKGFESKAELFESRLFTAKKFRESIHLADIFVFTLGLTERWINKKSKLEYSICPGTKHGIFDPSIHEFQNIPFKQIHETLSASIEALRAIKKDLKILLTVSPVPLTATFQKQHALVATIAAKSSLRAVAEILVNECEFVDYFPSYEIVSSFPFKSVFFEPNLRSVNQMGVDFVMNHFFSAANLLSKNQPRNLPNAEKVICEEELLLAFRS